MSYVNAGDKFLLYITKYDREAYTDQMGISHSGYVVLKEVDVVVVEVRSNVRDMWTDAEIHEGWKALDKKGIEYTCNWNVFPSDSMSPTYYWDMVQLKWNGVRGIFQPKDAVQVYNHPSIAHVKNNKKVTPKRDYITVCKVHQYAFYNHRKLRCYRCNADR